MSAVQLLLRPSPWVETFLLYFYCFVDFPGVFTVVEVLYAEVLAPCL